MNNKTTYYSGRQRLAWLCDHTRIASPEGRIEMWNILLCEWQEVRPDALSKIYPAMVRGSLTVEVAWKEIEHSARMDPSYEGERPPFEDYSTQAISRWAYENQRISVDDGKMEIRNPIDREWYSKGNRDWKIYIPNDFFSGRHIAVISRCFVTAERELRAPKSNTVVNPGISSDDAVCRLLFGGGGENVLTLSSDGESLDFDFDVFEKWAALNEGHVTSRRIVEDFLGRSWPPGTMELRMLNATLKKAACLCLR
ncbi:hypothetical protein GOB93_18235 [Acetobacter musti]|uniref:Uncharacterized protein n=1 Tax=Acetobacter musti TaxID=864732 RepID=A0ABX0JT91_9PROT|nr:hypothetical protein [Acetobacter musti]NHN86552.1 hypothetical protein [Acetobacter musti]